VNRAFDASWGRIGAAAHWARTSGRRAAYWFRQMRAEAERRMAPAAFKPVPQQWSDNDIVLAWLGHSTVLINFYGVRILTDPVLYNRVGIPAGLGTLGPKRYIAPALRVSELPPIDVLLLSHGHMDHMDLRSLRGLPRSTQTITAALTRDIVEKAGLKQIQELRWKEAIKLSTPRGELTIRAFEVNHWGERWPSELARGYNGYVLSREGKNLLFAGDTARTSLFREVKGQFEAAIMPIGAYDPWIRSHCTPEQALEMANHAGAKFILPVHHQTFRLSDERMSEPLERLRLALDDELERLALESVGQTFTCPRS
jgi:L-ascorbate metabolism protein UlaG (beta-lactamase superfamily)